MSIEIRNANKNDAQAIFELSNYWIEQKVLKQKFSIEQLENIICEGLVAVAMDGDILTSYYFINTLYDTGNVPQRKSIIVDLISEEILPKGNYALSLQSATNERYFGQGLNRKVLNYLRAISKPRYDYLVGIMGYDNVATHESSLKMGWKHFGDVSIGLLAVIATDDKGIL